MEVCGWDDPLKKSFFSGNQKRFDSAPGGVLGHVNLLTRHSDDGRGFLAQDMLRRVLFISVWCNLGAWEKNIWGMVQNL